MVKIIIQENNLTVQQFEYLYKSTGWPLFSSSQVRQSLKNDVYHISAWIENEIVGMGRLLGDMAMYWYIQNLIVLPEYQSIGVGTTIMNYLLTFVRNNSLSNSQVVIGLMCSEHTASFYQKFSFDIRPCDSLGPGATLELNL